MSAVAHNLQQGSPQWLQYRTEHLNASEASAMLGLSSCKSRDALVEEKATGIAPDINEATQRIFDEGHRLERQALPKAKTLVEEDLFQPTMSKTVDGLSLSASFDGLTMLDDIVWEHKTLNKNLKANLAKGIIPEEYKPQLEQQLLVSGAEKTLFMASNDEEEYHAWYVSDEVLRQRLINGWKQFVSDVEAWQPREVVVVPETKAIEALPSLNIQIEGGVTTSNLPEFEAKALAFIDNINTDLKTDSDFANAAKMVTFCDKTEKELDAVKKAALEQTADIAELFKTIDLLKSEMRDKRLELNRLVKSKKDAIRSEIVSEGKQTLIDFIHGVNKTLPNGVGIAFYDDDFNAAIKGKRTIESLRNACNTELARCKIEVQEQADLIRSNYAAIEHEIAQCRFLFNDLDALVHKEPEMMLMVVSKRIAEYEAAEQARIEAEAERLRIEQEHKAQEAARAKEAEQAHAAAMEKAAERTRIYNARKSEKLDSSNSHQEEKASVPNGKETDAVESKATHQETAIAAVLDIEMFVTCPNDECGYYIDLLKDADTNGVCHNDDGHLLCQIFPKNGSHDDFECDDVTCSQCKTTFNVRGLEW